MARSPTSTSTSSRTGGCRSTPQLPTQFLGGDVAPTCSEPEVGASHIALATVSPARTVRAADQAPTPSCSSNASRSK